MTNSNPKILIADDEPSGLALFKLALKDKFDVYTCADGDEALAAVRTHHPQVVLLDINMPKKNGYEVCDILKKDPATRHLPVIFVSAADSIEERMRGYDVGGDDYVIKPFDGPELAAKVARAVESRASVAQLTQEAEMARGMATEVMTAMGELGTVLNFMRSMLTCETYEDVARQLITALRSYRLPSVIRIRGKLGMYDLGTSVIVKPLESDLLDKLQNAGRIQDFDVHTIFNYGHISILIKDMPMDNKEFYGRIKDHAAILAEGADARVSAIDIDQMLKVQRMALEGVIHDTQKTIGETNNLYRALKHKNTKIMQDLLHQVEDLYMSLGLTEEQENRLSRVVNGAADQASALYGEDLAVSAQLADIQRRLQTVLDAGKN